MPSGPTDGSAEPTEIELKLSVADPAVIRAILEAPDPDLLAGFEARGGPSTLLVTDRYVDTGARQGRLDAAGYRARLRDGHGHVELTVKQRGTMLGRIAERLELKGPASASLDPGAWPDSAARRRLIAVAGDGPLVEVAVLRQRRLLRVLQRGETRVELSLDELERLAGETVVARRWELEAELLAGDREALDDLGAALAALRGVGPPIGSKLDFARLTR